jgi:hypothetical protein
VAGATLALAFLLLLIDLRRMSSLAVSAMSPVLTLALSPWRFSLQWLSWCAGFFFTALARAGVPPAGFVQQSKVRRWGGNRLSELRDLGGGGSAA